nr:glycosyltransferase family 87 protein [Paludisphaera mucosa]
MRHNLILLVVALVLPFLLARRRWIAAERLLFAAATVMVFVRLWRKFRIAEPVVDLINFHRSGVLALAGQDPYAPASSPMINPPTVLPLVKLFAMFSVEDVSPYWQASVAVMTILCPIAAWAALRTAREDDALSVEGEPAPPAIFPWGLAALVVVSPAAEIGIILGQFSALGTLALLTAIWLRNVGRPIASGLLLSVATIKVATLIPILTQFLGRRDRRVWFALAGGTLALALLGAPPTRWLEFCRSNLERIAETQRAGSVNDYDFATGEQFASVIGVGKLANYLGVRDAAVRSRVELIASLAGLLGLAGITRARRLPAAAAVATACTLACLFLYHRVYDSLILAAPLFYSFVEMNAREGWRRTLHRLNVVGLVLIPCTPWERVSNPLLQWCLEDETLREIARIAIVPFSTWLLLFALVVLLATGWRRGPKLA